MIQKGSKVSIHYTLKVEGKIVDSSKERGPLTFTHGQGEIIPGLEEELRGLKVGDKKSAVIPPEKGYGPRFQEAVQKVPGSAFQQKDTLKIGDIVTGQVSGKPFQATIVDISETEVTLDMNHPLAGKELNFDVEIVTVE